MWHFLNKSHEISDHSFITCSFNVLYKSDATSLQNHNKLIKKVNSRSFQEHHYLLGSNKGRIGSGQSGSQAGDPFGEIGNLKVVMMMVMMMMVMMMIIMVMMMIYHHIFYHPHHSQGVTILLLITLITHHPIPHPHLHYLHHHHHHHHHPHHHHRNHHHHYDHHPHPLLPHLHQLPLTVKLVSCLYEIPEINTIAMTIGDAWWSSSFRPIKNHDHDYTGHQSIGAPGPSSEQLAHYFQKIHSTIPTDQPGWW